MCIAVYLPSKVVYGRGRVPELRLREAHEANPDGCGFMWATNGVINFVKGCFDWCDFIGQFKGAVAESQNEAPDFIVHFRTASSGKIGDAQCHPFFIHDDLAFVENGNLFPFGNDDCTDAQDFNSKVLSRLPHNFLKFYDIRKSLEDYCRFNLSKFIFLDVAPYRLAGKIFIFNEQAGEWIDGCWYSNGGIDNYIGYGYSGAYTYKAGDVRHKGGLITVQEFENRNQWKRCSECGGYFFDMQTDKCHGCSLLEALCKYRLTMENF